MSLILEKSPERFTIRLILGLALLDLIREAILFYIPLYLNLTS